MPATKRIDQLLANYTRVTLLDKLEAVLAAAGWGVKVERWAVNANLDRLVYGPHPVRVAGDKPVYSVFELSNTFALSHVLTTSYTVATHTVGPITFQQNIVFAATTQPVNLLTLEKSTEVRLLLLVQGTTVGVFGLLWPLELPGWWDRGAFPPVLAVGGTVLDSVYLFSGALNPWNSGGVQETRPNVRSPAEMQVANTVTNARDIVPYLGYSNNRAYLGRSSDDLGRAATSGLAALDTLAIPSGSEEWVLLAAAATGVVVRTN